MYIVDGIAYAGEKTPAVKVSGVRPLENHRLWVRFSTGEAKIFDFAPLLDQPAFSPLQDMEVFRDVYIDYGVPLWMEGEIDISPQYLYDNAAPAETGSIA
jgi:hypothetical protein